MIKSPSIFAMIIMSHTHAELAEVKVKRPLGRLGSKVRVETTDACYCIIGYRRANAVGKIYVQ